MSTQDIERAKRDFLPPPGWKRNPVLLKLKQLDEVVSYRLALAYEDGSALGEFRNKLRLFEYSAHTLVAFGLAVFFWWMSISMTSRALFTNILLAMMIDVFVVAVVKAFARRRRPGVTREQYEVDPSSTNLSFPSGFVSRATLISLILIHEDFIALVPVLFLAWAVMIVVAKLLLGRFFIGDALAGVLIGYLIYQFVDLIWLDPDDVIALEAFFGGQLGDH